MNQDPPNLLLILTDQQAGCAAGFAGNPYLRTPAMDALAAEGVAFSAAYCTFPVCTPARGSLWTGQMPHQHRAVAVAPPLDQVRDDLRPYELGWMLSRAGYQCAYGGKWHAGGGGLHCSIDDQSSHGFERICGFNDPMLPDAVGAFLAARDRRRPFCLVASFDDPHTFCEWTHGQTPLWGPLPEPPASRDCPPLPPNFAIPPEEPTLVRLHRAMLLQHRFETDLSPDAWRRLRWAYFRLIERVDGRIGQVLARLQDSGDAARTLVVFSSDHGDMHGARQLHQKGVLYEESARVPLVFSGPLIDRPGRWCHEPVSVGLDLIPTLLDVLGIEPTSVAPPDGYAGTSLAGLLRGGQTALERQSVPAQCGIESGRLSQGSRMVRSRVHKYIAHFQGMVSEELFDLERDPGEMVNLALCSSHDATLRQHREMLRGWLLRTGDPFRSDHYGFSEERTGPVLSGDAYPVKPTLR